MNKDNCESNAPICGLEPVAELAHLAWIKGSSLCHPSHGCEDYHRAWGLVRCLIGHGQRPSGEVFFRREIGSLVNRGARRVLVSGGADAGVSAMVVDAFRAAGTEPEVVFVDRCATAIEVNARYAVVCGVRMQLLQSDVCELHTEPVDVVVAHTFLPFFEGSQRNRVLRAWHRNLKEGGAVLFSNVLRASELEWSTPKSPDAINKNVQELFDRALQSSAFKRDAKAIVEVARRFWSNSPGRPPGMTEQNVRQGLLHAGFADISIQYSEQGVYKGPLSRVRQHIEGVARAEVKAIKQFIDSSS